MTPQARSFRTILTDGGRATSSHPLENNDCSVRAVSLVTGLSYDEAWDELRGAGRPPLDGFEWEDWARKVGYIQAPWTGAPMWVFRHVSLPPRKGFPRVRPRDLPTIFPNGRWIMSSPEHVEAWIEGRHFDSPTVVRVLNPERIIFGAWECRKVAADQRLYMAYRVYVLEGITYKSSLGPVPGVSLEDAYRTAEKWYGHLVQLKNSDMIVERV